MIRRFLALSAIPIAALLLCQCGGNDPGPVLMGHTEESKAKADALYAEAEAEERKGDLKAAIKRYGEVADDYPLSSNAGEARYRQAMLLEKRGERRDAFEAYDKFLEHFPSHPKYRKALNRVYEVAIGAQRGDIQTNFLGIKGKLPREETLRMLTSVKTHAPKSDLAAKSQYAMGEVWLSDDRVNEAVASFRRVAEDHRNHSLAPEALFRIGAILIEAADKGNQNQATIDLAREAFNDYLIQFPGHKRNAEARKLVRSLDGREVQRSIEVADYYYKTKQWESAKIYYREVVKSAKSGAAYDRAKARLKELEN